MEAINENQMTRRQNLQRGKQKKFHFLKYNRNSGRQNNIQSGNRQQNYQQNQTSNNNSNESRNEQNMPNQQRALRNDQPQTSTGIMHRQPNTQLGRRRSNNKLNRQRSNTNTNSDKPRTWSSLLKPQQQINNFNLENRNNNNTNQQQTHSKNTPNEMEEMREKMKEMEKQLANKYPRNEHEHEQSPKNLTEVSSSGRDHLEINNIITNNSKEMEIEDILQIINTTMDTLKSFEGRYKKQGNTSRNPSGM